MRYLLIGLGLLFFSHTFSQENCEAYKYYGDTLKCKACEKAEESSKYYQFKMQFHQKLDEALKIDSTYAYAYREKSTAYLKSGDFITWKKIIDKAVKYDFEDNLGYRAWCRYQFFRDYHGAIKDIEKLESLVTYDIGNGINGHYHLNIAKAICYDAIGEKQKAIQIIENQLKVKNYFIGLFDYYQLGVLYYESADFNKALIALQRQIKENDLAEVHYYLALTQKKLNNLIAYKKELQTAKTMYLNNEILFDAYTHHYNKIFLVDIENELTK